MPTKITVNNNSDYGDAVGIKAYADGALGSRGAVLLEPYADRKGWKGLMLMPKPAIAEQILKLGFTLKIRDPAAFRPYHQQEIATWEKIIREAGVKPE